MWCINKWSKVCGFSVNELVSFQDHGIQQNRADSQWISYFRYDARLCFQKGLCIENRKSTDLLNEIRRVSNSFLAKRELFQSFLLSDIGLFPFDRDYRFEIVPSSQHLIIPGAIGGCNETLLQQNTMTYTVSQILWMEIRLLCLENVHHAGLGEVQPIGGYLAMHIVHSESSTNFFSKWLNWKLLTSRTQTSGRNVKVSWDITSTISTLTTKMPNISRKNVL